MNYRFVRSRVDELPHGADEEIPESFDAVTQLDYQIDFRNLLSAALTVFRSNVESLGVSSLRPFEASLDVRARGFNVSVMEQATLGRGAILQSLLSIQRFDLSVEPKRPGTARLTVDRLEGTYFNRFDRDSVRVELKQSLTAELGGGRRRHTLRSGYDLIHTTYDGTDAGFPVDLLRADGSRFERIEWVGGPAVAASNTERALFVQDRWRPVEKLQLDLALRYDHEQIAGEHHLSPRVSASLSPFGGEVTLIKGGLGLFYDKMLLPVGDFERRQRRQRLGQALHHGVRAPL